MQEGELFELISKVQARQTEMQNIECKSAVAGCPKRLYDTLSSFSNQDQGGILIFGLDENKNYDVVGVYDAQDLQIQVNNQCKQMSPCIRALFTVININDKVVVSAEIPAVDISERPVYYTGIGKVKGSYIRVGEADEPMTDYEIYSYEAYRRRIQDDIHPVDNPGLAMLSEEKLATYLAMVKAERKNLAKNTDDKDILELMGITANGVPTIAGLLSFSKYPQGCYPQLSITAVIVPGTELGDNGSEGERFIDNKRITGTIEEMLIDACQFVNVNMRVKTIIDKDGHRNDKTEYPAVAIREIILNALVHRDYSTHTQNTPAQIRMYKDRIEVINPGGLYGKLTVDNLGKVHPDTRNAQLANILEILKISENRYSGIPTIKKACSEANLMPPEFINARGEFKVVIRNNIYQEHTTQQIINKTETARTESEILTYCQTPKSRAEIESFVGYSRYYTLIKIIQPLLEKGLIQMTIPNKPKSKNQRFITTNPINS